MRHLAQLLAVSPPALAALFAATLVVPQDARADGFIIIEEPPPGMVLPHPPHHHHHRRPAPPRPITRHFPLEVREHHVSVEIDGQVATTKIDQTFYNPTGSRLEGTYIFPLPKGAEIDRFEMDVNGEFVTAELLDSKKARGIYEDIVRRAKDPALMEYSDTGLFKVRIFPIEPRSEKRVKIRYTQVLRRDGRITEYLYPLNTEKFSSRPVGSVSVKVELEDDSEIKSVYSPTHDIDVTRKGKRRAVAAFELSDTLPDTDFRLFYTVASDAPVGLEVLACPDTKAGEGHYMMMLSPGAWEDGEAVPKDVVFAVDTSGSMRVKKLDQAKAALAFCLDNLGARDRFDIVRYSTEAEPLFGELSRADAHHLGEARRFVEGFRAGGGTAIEEALLAAAEQARGRKKGDAARPFQIVFLTDGRPTIGETRPEKIVERLAEELGAAPGTVRVFPFGIGTDINTKLLDRVAEHTRGASEYALPEEDLEIKVSRFYSRFAQPVMADLKIEVEGGGLRLRERHPNDLPDLFKGDQLVLFGRYTTKGDAKPPRDLAVTLTGNLAGERQRFTFETQFRPDRDHAFIPRLWATRRVGYLLDQIRLHGEADEVREEVVALARRWGIVTPYTSYLIVEDEEARGVPLASQTMGRRRSLAAPSAESAPADPSGIGGRGGFGSGGIEDPAGSDALRLAEREAFDAFADAESGDGAVAGARASNELKNAETASAVTRAAGEARYRDRAQGAATAPVNNAPQSIRHLAGKTFYLNGSTWIDSEIVPDAGVETESIPFGSEAYFTLLGGATGDLAKWLSLGEDLRLLHDGKVLVITPAG